jgi:DnaJ-class molecular chaperone
VRIPGVTFLQISSKAVKKAYRNKSRLVHPDRNRDGRAEEAFIALEECASILSDDRQRAQYENQLKQVRNQRREKVFNGLHAGVRGSLSHGKKVFKIVRGVLGPFAFPITVLGCLLV